MADETQSTREVTIRVRDRGTEPPGLRCSFCRAPQDDTHNLIAGPGVFICSQCVALCVEILTEQHTADGVFRVGYQDNGQEGVRSIVHGPLPPLSSRWFYQCGACGTWNAGVKVSECLHCGAPRRQEEGGR